MAQELKAETIVPQGSTITLQMYPKAEVDAVLAEKDKQIAELNAENERLKKCEIWMKQHFYCEEVIACESAKNRRLQRALWLARAERADSKVSYWCVRFGVESGFTKVDIYGYSVNTKRKLRTIKEWFEVWQNVERKCRAKAEEYR